MFSFLPAYLQRLYRQIKKSPWRCRADTRDRRIPPQATR
jgi:hypothetical protein